MMSYAWFVLIIITLLEGFSGFGRTSALSPFLNDLCHDLALTSAQIGGAYSLANLFSGIISPYIGRNYDQNTPANFLRLHVLGFGGAFVALSMLKFTKFNCFFNFLGFLIGFTCIRIAVHAYTVAGRSLIAVWFVKNRGFATGISCFILSTIASTMPWLNFRLHLFFEWQNVWICVGLFWLLVPMFVCQLIKTPGKTATKIKQKPSKIFNKTLTKNPLYWLIMLALFFKAFQNTGIAFHLFPICEEFGAKPEIIALCFIVISLISTLTTFLTGHYFEIVGVRFSILLFLIVDCLFLFCFKYIHYPIAIYSFVIFSGLYWGMNQIIAYLVLPRVFGIKNIGFTNGWAVGFICFGSSMGPFTLGLMKTYYNYQTAMTWLISAAIILAIYGFTLFSRMKTIDTSHEKSN